MSSVYVYAVSYDLGFAPNPFGGICSLACCKPNIRQRAKIGDWIVGLTGTKLKPAQRCVFAMVVTDQMTFDEYWSREQFGSRKPKRNGSQKKLVGDNVYHRKNEGSAWIQEDSVHSLPDGTQCPLNTQHDTRVNRILLSDRFVYFGQSAPAVLKEILNSLEYQKNSRDYRRFDADKTGAKLVRWLEPQLAEHLNMVLGDPFDFGSSWKRFSATRKRMV